MKWWKRFVLMAADGDGGSVGGAPPPAPAPSPAPSPAPEPSPAPSPAPSPSPSPAPAPATDWREQFVGKLADGASDETRREHEALVKLAGRYNSLPEAAKALRAAQLKFSSGQVITKLPENATEAQLKEWRAENGVPEAPDKYELKLDPGMVLSAEDKQMLSPILAAAHKANARPEVVSGMVGAYFQMREEEIAVQVADNKKAGQEMKVALTEEWGPRDYQSNMDGIVTMLQQAGGEVAKAIEGAVDANGIQLIHNPAVMRFLARNAREGGFVGATLGTGGDFGAGMVAEKDKLQAMMVSDPDKYYADPKNAERLGAILAAEARRAGKNG